MSYLKKLIDYSNTIVSGEQLACKKHIWACQRFLNDVKKSQTDPDYPFYFDETRAEDFSKWARLFKHRKGVLAGKNIELAHIQHFIFGQIYGWYDKENHYRRFLKLYWQVGRKNAKSQTLALVSSYEMFVFCNDEVAEVYTAGVKKEQANIVYLETVAMVEASELEEGKHYKIANGRLIRLKNGAFMRALSKEDKKTGDGLDPQLGCVDEYHAHPTAEMLEVLDSGQISRPQPLLIIITTAGPELSHPCYRVEYTLISKILDPNVDVRVESYLVMVNELDMNDTGEDVIVKGKTIPIGEPLDDMNDPSVWIKANPIAASYPVGLDKIRKKFELAKEAPEKMRDFKTKNMNIWVNERAMGYMNMAKWSSCAFIPVKNKSFIDIINENTDRVCFNGDDLSAKLDLTSSTFELIGNSGEYYIVNHSFMPEERFLKGMKEDKVPYDLWEKQGYLTVTDGAVVNYKAVMNYFLEECKKNGWYLEEVCVDPWGATQIASDLDDLGHTVVEIIQGPKTLSEPTKNFREEAYQGNIVHENNPLFNWAISNAVTRKNFNGNIQLDKDKAKQRIDPVASAINAHTRAMNYKRTQSNNVMFM